MSGLDKWGVITWIGFLVLVFLVIVYFKGFTSDVGTTGSAVTGLVKQLQGSPSQAVLSQASGGKG